MKKDQIIRALRDPEFRASLEVNDKAELNGFGEIEMNDETLINITGGCGCAVRPTTWLASCVAPGEPCP